MLPYKYRTYNSYLKEIFNCRVYKVSVDGNFSCPNRDGTKSYNGCVFCDEKGSSSRTQPSHMSIKDQIINNIKIRKSRYKAKKFIVYFQSFTNTYANTDHLKKIYDEAINSHEDIVGLSIATRADCVDEEKIKLIASYKEKLPYVCIEYGMQTIHDTTLQKINRKETHQDFLKALSLTQKYNIDHCVHVILGLPDETYEMQMQTAQKLAKLNVQGIKIHLLVAMKNTPLEEEYFKGNWQPLSFDEYVHLASDFLEYLPPNCIIYRISGNGHPLYTVAPKWMYKEKKNVILSINQELIKKNSYQGKKFS
jgi:uncharacterized protein